jgi:hypothetical protein
VQYALSFNQEKGVKMKAVCEFALFPLIVLCGGLLESFFEHPILYLTVFTTTILVCMVLATPTE